MRDFLIGIGRVSTGAFGNKQCKQIMTTYFVHYFDICIDRNGESVDFFQKYINRKGNAHGTNITDFNEHQNDKCSLHNPKHQTINPTNN